MSGLSKQSTLVGNGDWVCAGAMNQFVICDDNISTISFEIVELFWTCKR
jgi:hypothetical protein